MKRATQQDSLLDIDLEEEAKDRQFVTALARGLEVLRAFQPGDIGLGNQEIAERTGLPKPTVSRLTHTLTRLGYLDYLERSGHYQLGNGVLALGYALLSGMDIRERARPAMQRLAREANAAVSLGSRDRLSMVYLEACHGEGAVALRLDIGSRIPIATTAMGRAFLAALPEPERAILLRQLARREPAKFERLRPGIERAVEEFRARGFTLSVGEWLPDVNAAGVPLIEPDGGVNFVLSCGAPAYRLTRERLEQEIGPRLLELAATLSRGRAGATKN